MPATILTIGHSNRTRCLARAGSGRILGDRLSGQLAAAALSECRLDVSKVSHRYQELLEEKILRELRAARFLARLLYHHPGIRNFAFRTGGQRLCEFVTDVVMGERSYSNAMKKPASYLKLFGL